MTHSQDENAPADVSDGWRDGRSSSWIPELVCGAYAALQAPFEVRRLGGGLLHQSFHIRAPDGEYVLQRVSDVFAAEIQDNIHAVTAHVAARGLPTPTLVSAVDGARVADLGALGRWRLMPHLGGVSFRRLRGPEQAESAGRLVGRFHEALDDFEGSLAPMGFAYRDTPQYLSELQRVLEASADHPLAAQASAIGREVLAAFETLGSPPDTPLRVIHGDLKLENLLFESESGPGADRAFALVDLDTLMYGPLWVELGDAWRSWCNTARDEDDPACFDLELFESSLRGYVAGLGRLPDEAALRSLAAAPERLALELCARFVTDVFEESYFAWDETRFDRAGAHHLARARGQWAFFEAASATRAEREAILESLSTTRP